MLLIIFVLIYVFVDNSSTKVIAYDLASNYTINRNEADKNYLNKEIELTGIVSAYYDLENESDLLQLKSGNKYPAIYCILTHIEDEQKAGKLTSGTEITINGKCLGLQDRKFPESIYIEVITIK